MYSEASLSFSKKIMESGSDTMTKMYEQNADYRTEAWPQFFCREIIGGAKRPVEKNVYLLKK